ncbi:MAG: GAF domain-containing protein [Chloroflexi bacterium]|nr:MAG: hypothetical protein CUN54_05210 [Phototrophicales bacterium]RMF79756.1 MAG: GAF domain-containing protein [Chloroflexota bacterium]
MNPIDDTFTKQELLFSNFEKIQQVMRGSMNPSEVAVLLSEIPLVSQRVIESDAYCEVYIATGNGKKYRVVAATSSELLNHLNKQIGTFVAGTPKAGVLGEAVRNKDKHYPVYKTIYQREAPDNLVVLPGQAVRSRLVVPIVISNQCFGVIVLESPRPNLFTEQDQRNIELLASFIAPVIEHQEQTKRQLYRVVAKLGLDNLLSQVNKSLAVFNDVTTSDEPLKIYNRSLDQFFADLCQILKPQYAFVLAEIKQDDDADTTAFEFHTRQTYNISGNIEPEQERYFITHAAWDHIYGSGSLYVGTFQHFASTFNLNLLGNLAVDARNEMGILVVDEFLDTQKIVLLFINQKPSSAKMDQNYFSYVDYKSLFELIALRLRDSYNVASHLNSRIEFEIARQEFVQDVMHQLNSSANTLATDAYILMEGIVPPEDYPAAFKRLYEITNMTRHYTETVSLAAQSRHLSEIYTGEPVAVDAEMLIQLLQKQSRYFQGKSMHANIAGPQVFEETFYDFPLLHLQVSLFELVVFNFIDNAVKYTIRDYSRNSSNPALQDGVPIIISGDVADDYVDINFTNHGIPLTEVDIKRIFERYYRAPSAKRADSKGTGIGLYLCKTIVEECHKGKIIVEPSQPSSLVDLADEITFTIRLPYTLTE